MRALFFASSDLDAHCTGRTVANGSTGAVKENRLIDSRCLTSDLPRRPLEAKQKSESNHKQKSDSQLDGGHSMFQRVNINKQ